MMQLGAVSTPSSSDHGSSSAPSVAPVKVNATGNALSPWDFPQPADLHGIRRRFPDRWMSFLHGHFQGPTHVAAFFDVDRRTATDWWNGKHGVNSAPVIFAMRVVPGAAAFLLEAA